MIVLADSTTAWIGALSTAMLGAVGLGVTVWQWRQSGFRPRFHARVEPARRAFELRIANAGRAAGMIHVIGVVRPFQDDFDTVESVLEGTTNEQFGPWELPAHGSMRAILQVPPPGKEFEEGVLLYTEWGADEQELIEPEPVDVALSGMASLLPIRQVPTE